MDYDQLSGIVLGQGGTLLLLLSCLVWAMRDRRRLQRACNRRTAEYIALIAKVGNVELPVVRGMEQVEDDTTSGL